MTWYRICQALASIGSTRTHNDYVLPAGLAVDYVGENERGDLCGWDPEHGWDLWTPLRRHHWRAALMSRKHRALAMLTTGDAGRG